MSATIEVKSIVKKFGDFTAVDGVSFTVEAGEVFGLLGPNGAGKSTLIRMLVTLLPPTAGSAAINGFDVVKRADDVRRSIGVIPQAMTTDVEDPVGVYFGTTSGEVWASGDEGESWRCVARHLPEIYSVEIG